MPIHTRARPEYSRVVATGFLDRDAVARERDAAGRDELARDEPERERDDFVPEAMA